MRHCRPLGVDGVLESLSAECFRFKEKHRRASLASRTGGPGLGVHCALDGRVARHHTGTLGLRFRLQPDLAVLHFNCVFDGLAAVLFADLISLLLNERREALDVASH